MREHIQLIILYSSLSTKKHLAQQRSIINQWHMFGIHDLIHYNAAQEKTELGSREKTNKQDSVIVIATRSNSSWKKLFKLFMLFEAAMGNLPFTLDRLVCVFILMRVLMGRRTFSGFLKFLKLQKVPRIEKTKTMLNIL